MKAGKGSGGGVGISRRRNFVLALLAVGAAGAPPASPSGGPAPQAGGPAAWTYADLVRRLTDMEALATLPDPGERAAQWTSRDRASAYDAAGDQYQRWDANGDGTGFIGDNGDGGRIMARMDGPGCIWRIWTARAGEGHVKIFLDGSAVPAVDLPFKAFFDRSQAPFTYPSLVYAAAGGLNNYVPIPYAKSAKVVAYGDWGAYYHIGYSTFSPSAVVSSFARTLSADSRAALEAADAALRPETPIAFPAGTWTQVTREVPQGGSAAMWERAGQGSVADLRIRVDGLDRRPRAEQWAALRELTLSMQWDGASVPAVWAPLGDFFGVACGLRPHRSVPAGLDADGWFYSRWSMPFASGARITVGNDGPSARTISAEILLAQPAADPATLGRFHAKWIRDIRPHARADRRPDHILLRTAGRGRFLGFMLHLFKGNDAVEGGSEPGEYWWGEGDEKFFVDGEKEPSWFGTGSEDYFGFAWATPDYFSRAYHHQLYNEGGIHMKGSRVLARFQVQDHVPFQTSFEAALEKYYKAEANVAYAVMPWWYQQAGTEDGYGPVPLAARTGWYPGPGARDPARLEGEDLDVRSATSGSLVVQDMGTFAGTWSAGKHLLWFKNNLGDVGPGAIATWTVEATSPGRYGVHAALTQAPDFGSFRFRIDGKACGGTVDLYGGSVAARAEQKLCDATLEAGSHALEAVVTGRNGASSGHYLGLDYLRLEGQPTALPARAKAKRALKPARKAYDMRGRALEAGTPTHGRLER